MNARSLKGTAKRLYALIRKNSRAGQAWNGQELAKALKMTFSQIDHVLLEMAGSGLIYSPGKDATGSTWALKTGRAKKYAVGNPKGYGSHTREEKDAALRSAKKALSWYGKEALVNAPKVLRGFEFPDAFVDAGTIEAIEYSSDKFDGKERLFRHDVTKKRRMLLSVDGSTIIVWPPFKLTKRGIEG